MAFLFILANNYFYVSIYCFIITYKYDYNQLINKPISYSQNNIKYIFETS